MKDNATPIETLFEKAENFSKTTLELFKLNVIDKTSEVASTLAVQLVLFMVVALFTLIINIGIALWVGEMLGKTYYGFFAIGTFYFLIIIILYAFRNSWIKYPISNSIISQILKEKL